MTSADNYINGTLSQTENIVGTFALGSPTTNRVRITQDGSQRITSDGSVRHLITIAVELTISGTLAEEAELVGTLHGEETLQGNLASTQSVTATLTVPPIRGGVIYDGAYEVTPKASEQTVLETRNKLMTDDVTVLEIPYYETYNTSGYTVYIANEV